MQARYGILQVLLEVIECIVTLTVVGPHAGALWHPTSAVGGWGRPRLPGEDCWGGQRARPPGDP